LLLEGLYKWRAKVRREIINTKILTNDLGSFCYKLCKELLPQYLQTEGVTIFINDKVAGILRLRGTSGLASGELLRDVVVEHSSRSWVAKAFSSGTALAEYSKHGSLVKGRTSENVLDIFSRIYWPIQVQHRLSEDVARRAKRDQVIGVIRLVNIESSYDKVNNNPFSILDFIRVAFLAELIYMMIESFSDLKVEGFDRDVAFHGASASADGILKNISMVESLLFGENEIYTTPRQFKLEPLHAIQDEVVRRCLRNALAYAHDLVGQIDRATPPQELLFASGSGAGGTPKVERLLSDVIIATEKLIPMQMTVHQLPHRYDFGYFVAGNKVQPFAKDGSFGPLPSPVLGETQDLISVFRNVFENCVKYKKPNGPLKIEVSFREDADFVHVRVRDYGIGVAEQDAARIFTRGVRTAEARDRQMRGGGLGLWHCRELLRKTRAQIKAEVMQDGLSIIVSLRRAK
jgi:signal transduction histidine kinase